MTNFETLHSELNLIKKSKRTIREIKVDIKINRLMDRQSVHAGYSIRFRNFCFCSGSAYAHGIPYSRTIMDPYNSCQLEKYSKNCAQ